VPILKNLEGFLQAVTKYKYKVNLIFIVRNNSIIKKKTRLVVTADATRSGEMIIMKPIYVAIVGLSNYFGAKIFKPGQFLRLVKDFENDYDGEAIMAILEPVGAVGYVANSAHTVPLGCYSAGRLYDTFDTFAYGIVRFVTKEVVIVEIIEQMQVEIYVDGEESLFNDNIDEDE